MTETREDLHLPGLRAPGRARTSSRRAAARLLRPGGAQRIDGPSGAPAARGPGEPRARGEAVVANEAYRAVFLRVHPTGKMVLSLTTDSDGKESQYAQLVAAELGVPALDVKVVPADTDRFGVGHGFNTSPSEGTPAAIARATAKIRAKGQLLAGMALETPPETLRWFNGAWISGDGSDPRASRRSRTSPSTPTARVRCRQASRAGWTRSRSTATEEPAGARRSPPRPRRRPSARRRAPSRASCPSRSA